MNNSYKNLATKQELQEVKAELLQKLASKEELAEVKAELMQKLASKEDLAEVKTDVSILKADVSGLKEDVSGLKEDVGGLKHNFVSLEQKVERNSENIIELKMEIITMRENMVTKAEFSETLQHILIGQDKMIKAFETANMERKMQDLRHNRMMDRMDNEHARNDKQDRILNSHEVRIDELETNLVH